MLSFGGFLGMGETLLAVPWNALTLDTATKSFKLNVDKDCLKTALGFDKEHWPNMADATWAQSIHTCYGTKLYPDEPRHERALINSACALSGDSMCYRIADEVEPATATPWVSDVADARMRRFLEEVCGHCAPACCT